MRWWWFGPAVTKPEIARELRVMKENGIGGVEIQPVYPLELNDPATGFRNLPYLSNGFIDALRFAAGKAHELGMRVDITLGSGWPYGGPETPITEAAGHLRVEREEVPPGAGSVPVPSMTSGERLIAAFLGEGTSASLSFRGMQRLVPVESPRLRVPGNLRGPHTVVFFIASRTGMQVKRAGVGAEGFVLDHYSRQAIEHHLSQTGDRLMEAFGAHPPYAVFSDSLEVFASDWTGDFLAEFKKRRGYDLTPYLPALVGDIGPETGAIRHDWGQMLTELAEERYLTPIREWAHAHHTLFRSQTYGVPPVILSSNALVDLPEGEAGPHWRQFSPARWAASASHLYGRPVTSTETWTWLHSPAFRATPLDMKAEADLHFLQGINQLVGHGWPYSPPEAGESGWRFYAAAAFNDHNPWFSVMPDIAAYLQRISFLLRQGSPDNDVAVYLPTHDAWAGFHGDKVSVDRSMDGLLGTHLIPQILNAGYNFDFIDDWAIASAGVPYRVLILPGVERMPVATLQRLQTYVQKGGVVIATWRIPTLAPGFKDAGEETPRVAALAQALFDGSQPHARLVRDEQTLVEVLTRLTAPDFAVAAEQPAIGFIHRKLPWGDIYFVANTSNHPVETTATVRVSGMTAEWWNPFNGEATRADAQAARDRTEIPLKLAPYESRVLVFSKQAEALPAAAETPVGSDAITLDAGWTVRFPALHKTVQIQQPRSWTDVTPARRPMSRPYRFPRRFSRRGCACCSTSGAARRCQRKQKAARGCARCLRARCGRLPLFMQTGNERDRFGIRHIGWMSRSFCTAAQTSSGLWWRTPQSMNLQGNRQRATGY